MKFIFVHVPKAAGTTWYMSMRREWEAHRFKKIKTNWNLFDNPNTRYKIYRDKPYSEYDVVYGHFPYYKFYYLKEDYKWKIVTWIRDPIRRLISQYNHFRYRPLDKKVSKRRIVRNAKKKDIIWFSKVQSNFHTRYLGEDPSIYDFIGVVEKHDESIRQFNKMFNLRLIYEKHNVHDRLKDTITDKQIEEIMEDHEKDYEFYNKVIERYK